jgi:hypothetical protein
MPFSPSRLVAVALLVAVPPIAAIAQGSASKPKITRAEDLPRREYSLPMLPSELLVAPVAQLLPVADAFTRDIAADLAAYDIEDASTLRSFEQTRLWAAMLRGDWTAVQQHAWRLRELQDKPAGRQTAGVLAEVVAQAKAAGGGAAAEDATIREAVSKRYSAMPWDVVQDALKQQKGQLEIATPAVVVGGIRAQLDPAAKNAGMKLGAFALSQLVAARAQLEHVLPKREAVLAALVPIVERNSAAVAKPDRWSSRLVTLPQSAKARLVVVGIWDSGVDVALFKAAAQRGLAFDELGHSVPNLLRDLGDAAPRWPQLKGWTKGAMDLRAALDTDDARKLKQHVATLTPEQVKPFQEDLGLAGLYVHGTHVAGIAVAGNPFARVIPISMHWSHRTEPILPTMELAQRTAANYRTIVDALKAAGARVVNMSWRYGPTFYEFALEYHGVGKSADERKKLALELFAIERDALKAAFQSAPGILFVAGAGNEDNSADFVEYIPAGFDLPNLITAGAVDQAGEETSFSSFGRTVVVHANGFEIESAVPGGDLMKFSGTSMAAPQVTNLAAKLFALHPELTPVEAKALILKGARHNGRVNLIDPKTTLELAGV